MSRNGEAGTPRAPGDGRTADSAPELDEGGFLAAVRSALKDYHRPDRLRDNPLLRSRLVIAALRNGTSAPVQALRDIILAQCTQPDAPPKVAALWQVLDATYLTPQRSQQAAAARLNLSWGTYRRRLSNAVQMLAARLREAEIALVHVPPAVMAPGAGVFNNERSLRPGERAVRGIAGLLIVVAVGMSLWLSLPSGPRRTGSSAADPPGITLAVLPFTDMNRDTRTQYLGDGIADELINHLGGVSSLRVAARTSSFAFRGKAVDVPRSAAGWASIIFSKAAFSAARIRCASVSPW